jgi:hypothetical protein
MFHIAFHRLRFAIWFTNSGIVLKPTTFDVTWTT